MSAVRPPTGVLTAPERRPLPPPEPLRAMFGPGVIAGLLLWLNHRCFHGPLRPSPLRWAALAAAIAFFGFFSGLTLWDRIAEW